MALAGQEASAEPAGQGAWVEPAGQGPWVEPAGQGAWVELAGQRTWVELAGQGAWAALERPPGQQHAPEWPPGLVGQRMPSSSSSSDKSGAAA